MPFSRQPAARSIEDAHRPWSRTIARKRGTFWLCDQDKRTSWKSTWISPFGCGKLTNLKCIVKHADGEVHCLIVAVSVKNKLNRLIARLGGCLIESVAISAGSLMVGQSTWAMGEDSDELMVEI